MKTLNKKILTVCLALAMAVVMALPTFAANVPITATGIYKFFPNGARTHLLNVYGNGYEGNNVTLYRPTYANDQEWRIIRTAGAGVSWYVVSQLSSTQALNIYHATSNCQLHSYINNTTDGKDDSAIVFNSNKGTVILRDWRYNLCFGLIADDSNVYWSNQQESAWEWEKQ